MRNIFFSNFPLSYQYYLASLAFSDFAIHDIIYRVVITFLLSGFFSLNTYLWVWVLGAINMNRGQWFGVHQPSSVWEHTMSKARQLEVRVLGANNRCLAWEMYGNTPRLTCLLLGDGHHWKPGPPSFAGRIHQLCQNSGKKYRGGCGKDGVPSGEGHLKKGTQYLRI